MKKREVWIFFAYDLNVLKNKSHAHIEAGEGAAVRKTEFSRAHPSLAKKGVERTTDEERTMISAMAGTSARYSGAPPLSNRSRRVLLHGPDQPVMP